MLSTLTRKIYIPIDDEYTCVLTGTAAGEMSYSVEETSARTKETSKKVFSSIELDEGKVMISDAEGNIAPQDVRIFILDDNSIPAR